MVSALLARAPVRRPAPDDAPLERCAAARADAEPPDPRELPAARAATLAHRLLEHRGEAAPEPPDLPPGQRRAGRCGAIFARHSASSASRFPTPAMAPWSSSRAFTARRERSSIRANCGRVIARGVRPETGRGRRRGGRVRAGACPRSAHRRPVGEPQREPVDTRLVSAGEPPGTIEPLMPRCTDSAIPGVGVEPQRLALAPRADHRQAAQHARDLARRVRPADVAVGVVGVVDDAPDGVLPRAPAGPARPRAARASG